MMEKFVPALTMDVPMWAQHESVQRLMNVLYESSDKPNALFVGGCVRNAVIGKEVSDIDIATQLTPETVLERLKKAGIKAILTGVEHGTVTAVIEKQPFEITTLRRDVSTDGRRATVEFTADWVEDARRRDFTMNTLLMDMQGHVYDPLGNGIEDAKAGRVVFVGKAKERIEEDYLRILRFFRFHAFYGQGDLDADALMACRDAADQISTLSRERITQEFLKILSVKDTSRILQIIFDSSVLGAVFDKNYQSNVLQKLCDLQETYEAVDVMPRLFVVAGHKASLFEELMRLSHAQKNFLIKLEMVFHAPFFEDERAFKKAIFHHGNELLLQGYLLAVANGKAAEDTAMIELLQNWQAPECPINGAMLIAEGYQTGPELGQELSRRQEEWLEEIV